jgi:hypothetical protein
MIEKNVIIQWNIPDYFGFGGEWIAPANLIFTLFSEQNNLSSKNYTRNQTLLPYCSFF